jgi:polyhydroxybutyrate depolymerase
MKRRMGQSRVRFGLTLIATVVVATVLTLTGCATSSSAASPTHSASSSSIEAGSTEHTMSVDGMQRSYRVYRPASLPTGASAPLVVMLHGSLGTGQQAEDSYGWDCEADQGHFVVAYPDGYKRTWNASDGGCCGPAAAKHLDDVGFITKLVKVISEEIPIDQSRIYATGISNGAAMAYRLACDTNIFAAIGPDSANLLGDCPSPAAISVIHIHGTADQTFPYAGGPGKRDNGGTGPNPANTSGPPIPAMIGQWRTTDSCAPPTQTTAGAVTTSLASCPNDRAVELITISGAGHQWPGAPGPKGPISKSLDPPFPGLNATDTIWQFFETHPKS